MLSLDDRPSDVAHVDRHVCCHLAPWAASLRGGALLQRGMGGPVSRAHACMFRGAIYLPMLAGMLAYTHLAPVEYEGEPYFALTAARNLLRSGLGRSSLGHRLSCLDAFPKPWRARITANQRVGRFIPANGGWFSPTP